MEQNEQPVFGIEKLYVKDLSVEVPHAPEIFLEREAPQIEIQLGTSGRAIGEGVYEVVLTVTVTAKMQEKAVFLVEIGQGGIFRILNVPNEQIEPLIAVACPNILFPYAREAVSDAGLRADRPAAGQFRGHVHAAFAGTGGSPAPDRSHDSIRCEHVAPSHCSPCPDRRRRCGAGP